MKLPEINITPIHTLDLPILGKTVSYKPYTVEQEKLFLTALEDNKISDVLNNFLDIIKANVEGEINFENLSMIDFLYFVIYLRAKSKGETFSLKKEKCNKCSKAYEFEVNVDDCIKIKNKDTLNKTVTIAEGLVVDVKPLDFQFLYTLDEKKNEYDLVIDTAVYSIKKIIFNETIYNDLEYKDIRKNFVNNLTEKQLIKIFEASKELINMYMEIDSVCVHCGNKETVKVTDFLSLLG